MLANSYVPRRRRDTVIIAWCWILAVLALHPRSLHAGSSIFDDDWKPATRPAERSDTAPNPPSPNLRENPTPAPPSDPPADFNPPTHPGPIPDGPQLAAARKLFRELFATELADSSSAGRRSLALRLFEEARRCADKPADQYVLLAAARQAALDANDLQLSFKAVDVLAATFEVDGPTIKALAVANGGLKAATTTATWDNCRAALQVFDQLVAAAQYDVAAKLIVPLTQAVAGDSFLKTAVAKRARDLEPLRVGNEKFVKATTRLKVKLDDPAANQDAGMFLCFIKGDWEGGLPMLARGTQTEIKGLATTEVAGIDTSDRLQKVAANWAGIALKQPDAYRFRIQEHALMLYRKALAGATGLQKRAIESAMQKLQKSVPPNWIDLLPLVRPERDVVHGKWFGDSFALTTQGQSGRLELPYIPPGEYAFRIDFTVHAGQETVFMGLTKDGKAFQWVMGNLGNRFAGFQLINGEDAGKNKGSVKQQLTPGRRYTAIVEVYGDKLKATVDGQPLVEWPTDFHELSHHSSPNWAPREPSRLAVGSWSTAVTFHRIEVLELSGAGVLVN